MPARPLRLERYVSLASLPTIAAMTGLAGTNGEATAEIVHEAVSITAGGPGIDSASLLIGSLGMVNLVAGTNPSGPGMVFAIEVGKTRSGAATGLGLFNGNAGTASKPVPNGKLARFAAGDAIMAASNLATFVLGVGAKSNPAGGYAPEGYFLTNGEGPQAGYVGFVSDGGNYGWISVQWDGSFVTVDGYAYETEANTAIAAGAVPAPGAVGLLALAAGAAGLRRKRQA